MASFSAHIEPYNSYLKSKKGRARFSLFLFLFPPVFSQQHTYRSILCLLIILYTATGCACSALTFLRSSPGAMLTPEEILETYNENYYRLRTFKGKGYLLMQTEEFNEKGTVHVLIKMPDSLKVKLEGPFGMDVVSLFLDSNEFLLYLHRDEEVFYGRLDTFNLSQLLHNLTGFPLFDDAVSFHDIKKDVVDFFAGVAPLDQEDIIPVNAADSTRRTTIFKMRNASSETMYEFPVDLELLHKIQIVDAAQEIRVEKRFSRYSKIRSVHIPRRIRYTFYREKGQIALQYFEVQVNKTIKPQEFHIEIPLHLRSGINDF